MKSPLDTAILAAHPFDMTGWKKLDEVPFDFERRRVSVLVAHATERRLIVKGAPEELLRLSERYAAADGVEQPLDLATRRTFEATLDALGAQGFRALGIASKLVDGSHQTIATTDESDLVFAGFAVFLDPPKTSAGATIQAMAAAGITVKVLTGDNERVARHVFAEIGVPVTGVLTGDALDHLTEEALFGQLPRINLFCRVNPQQKLRVLLALKRLGHVVGFLGDGINDAPALHAADVGISVDGAADVARAAADLILLEHDLSVVREAVTAGRSTVQNVSKYVLMGASSNFGNMFSMAGAALILPFLPMLPIQILLNNLIYNVSEIAIPFDHVDPESVVGPVKWDVKLIERFMLVFGPVSSIFDFLTFYALLYLFSAGEALFQTGWFIESMTTQILVVFCIRTRRRFYRSRPCDFLVGMTFAAVAVAIALPLLSLGRWFGFVMPPPLFFVFLTAATLAYLALVELTKAIFYRAMAATLIAHQANRGMVAIGATPSCLATASAFGKIVAPRSVRQRLAMNAAENPAGGDVDPRRSGDVGVQRVADRQHASDRHTETLQHRLVDRRIRLAERADVAAQFLIAQRQRAGAQHAHAATDHLHIGVGADHRQMMARAVPQHVLEFGHLGGIAMIVRAGVEHEIRVRGLGHLGQVQTLQHAAVAFRAEVEDALAEFRPPQIGRALQGAAHRLAAGQDVGVEVVRNAHRAHHRLRCVVRARHVGQQQRALARLAQPGEAIDGMRKGVHAVMDDAPQIEDEAVIPVGERGEAWQVFHQPYSARRCASLPTASCTRAKPPARRAAASSRFSRGISAGPA